MLLYEENLEALGEELKLPVNNQHQIAKHVDIMNPLAPLKPSEWEGGLLELLIYSQLVRSTSKCLDLQQVFEMRV